MPKRGSLAWIVTVGLALAMLAGCSTVSATSPGRIRRPPRPELEHVSALPGFHEIIEDGSLGALSTTGTARAVGIVIEGEAFRAWGRNEERKRAYIRELEGGPFWSEEAAR